MKRICTFHVYSMAIAVLFSALSFTCPANGQEDQIETESDTVLAILYPLKIATLSAEVSSVVKKIHLDMGEEFKKGDTLIVLDPAYCWADKKKQRQHSSRPPLIILPSTNYISRNPCLSLSMRKQMQGLRLQKQI